MALRNSNTKTQYLAVLTVNIISFGHGLVLGWLSPVLPLLQSDESPLETGPITVDQTSWIGSILCIGGFFGTYIFAFLSDRLGRKFVLNFLAIPQTGFWLFVMFGDSYYHLYLARICAGLTGGGIFTTIPLYIADIAEPKIRGRLGTMLLLIVNTGILVSYIIGTLASYTVFPFITISIPIIFTLAVMYFPETPQSLVKSNQLVEAGNSYRYYRGIPKGEILSKSHSDEYEEILLKAFKTPEVKRVHMKDFGSKAAIKGLAISIMLVLLIQFSGRFTFITYAGIIFRDVGSSLSPNVSSIIMAILQIIGSGTSTILVDNIGRKVLLLTSLTGSAIGLILLGCFSYFDFAGYDVTSFAIMPVISVSMAIFFASCGILTLPFLLVTEVLPEKIRTIGQTISVTVLTIMTFLVLKFFPILVVYMHLFGSMWLYAGVCVVGIVFIAFMLPETKGKNLNVDENKQDVVQ